MLQKSFLSRWENSLKSQKDCNWSSRWMSLFLKHSHWRKIWPLFLRYLASELHWMSLMGFLSHLKRNWESPKDWKENSWLERNWEFQMHSLSHLNSKTNSRFQMSSALDWYSMKNLVSRWRSVLQRHSSFRSEWNWECLKSSVFQ